MQAQVTRGKRNKARFVGDVPSPARQWECAAVAKACVVVVGVAGSRIVIENGVENRSLISASSRGGHGGIGNEVSDHCAIVKHTKV